MDHRFDLRGVLPEEAEQAAEIELLCFPPNEACKRETMLARAEGAADTFLVAVDGQTGRMAGFISGIATGEPAFRDAFFTDLSLHDPEGDYVMILSVAVHPDYRRQGLARAMMEAYLGREEAKGRRRVLLTCLEDKVRMYEGMGYHDDGMADSAWGGEAWHEMHVAFR